MSQWFGITDDSVQYITRIWRINLNYKTAYRARHAPDKQFNLRIYFVLQQIKTWIIDLCICFFDWRSFVLLL